uniref:Uncharacterized protein n=1 Tax=Rhizophora mucronata TaxID=61149 RepID=A0A2P2N0A2_RHIMU
MHLIAYQQKYLIHINSTKENFNLVFITIEFFKTSHQKLSIISIIDTVILAMA